MIVSLEVSKVFNIEKGYVSDTLNTNKPENVLVEEICHNLSHGYILLSISCTYSLVFLAHQII